MKLLKNIYNLHINYKQLYEQSLKSFEEIKNENKVVVNQRKPKQKKEIVV